MVKLAECRKTKPAAIKLQMAKEDQPDAEYVEAMLETRAWRLFSDKLQVTYKKACDELKRAEGSEVYRAQGRVAAYELAMSLPQIIIQEAKQ